MVVISSYLGKYIYAIDFLKDLLLLLVFILAWLLSRSKQREEQSITQYLIFYGLVLDTILLISFYCFEIFFSDYVKIIGIFSFGHQILLLILGCLSLEIFLQVYRDKN